jgi:hypothetical protein
MPYSFSRGFAPYSLPAEFPGRPSFMCKCNGTGWVRRRNPHSGRMKWCECDCDTGADVRRLNGGKRP